MLEIDYDYNLRGLITQLTYPGPAPRNRVVTRAYDDAGRLTQVALSTAWVTGAQPNNFTYDQDGNLCLIQYGNGLYYSRAFDAADRLSAGGAPAMIYGSTPTSGCYAVGGPSLLSLSYPRDANGKVTAENATAYGYDALNRLSSAGGASYTSTRGTASRSSPMAVTAAVALAEAWQRVRS